MICCIGAAIGLLVGLAFGGLLMIFIPVFGFALGLVLDILIFSKITVHSSNKNEISGLLKQSCCSKIIKH